MPWSSRFVRQINSPRIRPRWVLENVEGTGFQPVQGVLRLSSHPIPGYNEVLTRDGNRYSAGRLEVGTWSQTMSELVLGIRPVVDIRSLIARGQLVVLRLGFDGWPLNDFEPIYFGHVQGIDRTSGERWSLIIRSAVSSLVSRMVGGLDVPALFGGIQSTTIATTVYTAGDATINVASTTGAEKDTGGNYLLQVYPDAGSDPFFVTATGKTAATFTGCSATGILGTTVANAAIGNVVVMCAYIQGNPTDVIRKILCSTGTATNGVFDTAPDHWGHAIPDALVDHDDIDLTERIVDPPGAGMVWDVYSTEGQSDGLGWVQSVLGPAGIVVCERQGLLTVRAVSPSYDRPYGVETITNDDIMSIERQETWASEAPLEYAIFLISAAGTGVAGSNVEEDLTSRPAGYSVVSYLDYVSANATNWEESVRDRIAPWRLRLAEIVEVQCLGLRLAALAPCDSVVINSHLFRDRDNTDLPSLMVIAVEPNWWEGTVRLVLALIPADESEF